MYTQFEPFLATLAFDGYLLLLVWAVTLPLKFGNWQLKVGVVLPFLEGILESIFRFDEIALYVALLIFLIIGLLLFQVMLQRMAKVLQYHYLYDLHGLATRLSTKIIAGLPVACYLAMTIIQCDISYHVIQDGLCPYIPGAYYDKE